MSAQPASVLLALTPVAERAIEHLLFGDNAPLAPQGSVAEADELDSPTSRQSARAVLLSPRLSGLTPGHCERLRTSGLRLVGVALDEDDEQALRALPLDAVIDTEVPPDAVAAAVAGEPEQASAPPRPQAAAREDGDGTALAIIGSRGAPGASECAASLAALAMARWPTLLIELDALGGGLDVRIGADPRRGSVLGVIRAAAAGEAIAPELLERWTTSAPSWPPVLLGPAESNDALLTELARPGVITAALRSLRRAFPLSVWDVGFLLGAGGDIAPAARVHREAVVSADAVLLVLGARDSQLRPGLAQLDLLLGPLAIPPERLRIIVNGVGGPGASSEHALNQALLPKLTERGLTADSWLAWDDRALRRSCRRGVPVAIARPKGRYATVLTNLLDELFLPASTQPRGRKRRLAQPVRQPARETEEVALPWRT